MELITHKVPVAEGVQQSLGADRLKKEGISKQSNTMHGRDLMGVDRIHSFIHFGKYDGD